MMRFGLPALTLFLLSAPAHAECTYPAYEFFPEKNGGMVVEMKVSDGASCTHNFAEGPGYKFTSVAIDRQPEHGSVKKDGVNHFVYRPSPGFKGRDFYGVKICATKGAAKGCVTIYYLATVE
jgi:hypothetical protein